MFSTNVKVQKTVSELQKKRVLNLRKRINSFSSTVVCIAEIFLRSVGDIAQRADKYIYRDGLKSCIIIYQHSRVKVSKSCSAYPVTDGHDNIFLALLQGTLDAIAKVPFSDKARAQTIFFVYL